MQGPFRGVAGSLARVFGGTVTLKHGTAQARDIQGIFRLTPLRVEAHGGAEIETIVPVLRAPRDELADLAEGDVIDPKDGRLYRFLFEMESASPSADALVPVQCEVIG
jgi:hypothetical protein